MGRGVDRSIRKHQQRYRHDARNDGLLVHVTDRARTHPVNQQPRLARADLPPRRRRSNLTLRPPDYSSNIYRLVTPRLLRTADIIQHDIILRARIVAQRTPGSDRFTSGKHACRARRRRRRFGIELT